MPSLPRLKNSDNFAQWATKINDAFTQFESFTSVALDTTDPQSAEFAIYDASFKNKAIGTYYVTTPTTVGELIIGASGISNNMAPGEYGLIFTGGSGTGATGVARLSYGSTGVYVSSITLANSGTGYTSAPTVTIAGATGFTTNYSIIASSPYNNEGDISVTLRSDNYRVGSAIQVSAGSGYGSAPDVTISNPPFVVGATGFVGSSGTLFGATGFAQNTIVMTTVGGVPVTGDAQYRFYKATKAIADSSQVPYHSSGISGNWLFVGRRATATATVTNNSVTSVTITDKGYGYTSTPATITFSGSGGASYTAKMYSDAIVSLTPNSIYNKNNVSSLTDVIRSNNFLCIYDSTTDSLKKIAISVITPDIPTGAVLFGSPTDSYTWDLANLYWDDVNNRLGIATNSPDALLTVAGAAAFGGGTVSTPSITRTGDLNTGIWFPASDTIAVSTNGGEKIRINSGPTGTISIAGNIVSGATGCAWNGDLISGQYGGTGNNNGANIISVGGNLTTASTLTTAGAFTTSGAYSLTLTTTATTNATLPSGTTTLVPTDGTGATGTWSIAISGNAATATKLSSSKTISLTGSVTGSTSTDFTGNVSINTSLANQNSDALPSTIVVRDGSGSFNINVLGATGVALNTGASTSVRLEGISGATGIIRFPTSNSGTVVTTTDSGTVTSTMIADGTIVNGDISGSAAIAKSKLALTNAIVDADINTSAAIAVSKLAASTISGIVLGNNLNTLTLATSGVGLSGSGSYNGSGAVTFTVASDATNTNTPSTLVSRDASGNFAGGTITAATTFSGPGISLTNLPAGQLTGTIPSGVLGNSSLFVGTTSIALNRASANLALTGITSINAISIPASSGNFVATGDTGTVTNNMLAGSIAYNKLSLVGTIVNADISASASIAISKLAFSTISGVSLGNNLNTLTLNTTGTGISGSGSYNGSGAVTFTVTANSVALSATPNSLVLRDGNGDFTGRYINSTYFNSTDDVSNGTISYIVAKFSPDNYYRSATAAKVATFISGQTMNISGNATTVTNGVYTTGSYADPSWITSLAGSKITGNISGNAANITAYTINQSVGTGNSPSFAGLTVDTNTLYVDATNDRVGITTTSPVVKLHVVSSNAGTPSNAGTTMTGVTTRLGSGSVGFDIGTYSNGAGFIQNRNISTHGINYDLILNPNGGNVGINTPSPSYALHVSGAIYATGDVYAGSDIRMKENITELTNALDKIKNLQGYSYNKIGVNHRSIGLMAQDVEKIIPEVVSRNTEGMKGIDYGQMIAMLVEAIKELNTKLETINGTSI